MNRCWHVSCSSPAQCILHPREKFMFEERSEVGSAGISNTARWAAVVVLLLVVAIGGMFAYSMHQRTMACQRELEKQQIEQELSQPRKEIEAVRAKLSPLSVQQQQQTQ